MNTRAETLRTSIAYSFRKLRIGDKRGRLLTEAERYALADQVVTLLKPYGDLWRLNEPMPAPIKPSAMSVWNAEN